MKLEERPHCREVIIERLITPEMVAARPHDYSDGIRLQMEKMVKEGFDFDYLRGLRIDGSPTLHKLEYHINFVNLNWEVTLDKLEDQLTEVITQFIKNYPEWKLSVDPSRIRVDSNHPKQKVRIDVYEND